MPGILKSFAQNVTRTFAVTQDSEGAYFYSVADIDNWVAANASKVDRVSGSLIVVPGTASGSTFLDVVLGEYGNVELGGSGVMPRFTERKSLKDMGREIVIGSATESRLLVLRLVQNGGTAAGGSDVSGLSTAYVVVENNCEDLEKTSGKFAVRVARL
jgi:hypothetical protein